MFFNPFHWFYLHCWACFLSALIGVGVLRRGGGRWRARGGVDVVDSLWTCGWSSRRRCGQPVRFFLGWSYLFWGKAWLEQGAGAREWRRTVPGPGSPVPRLSGRGRSGTMPGVGASKLIMNPGLPLCANACVRACVPQRHVHSTCVLRLFSMAGMFYPTVPYSLSTPLFLSCYLCEMVGVCSALDSEASSNCYRFCLL